VEQKEKATNDIRAELKEQLTIFEKHGKVLEYERLKRRVKYDLEMIKNVGYCNGIENYSRHFDGRVAGEPPFTLLDYFGYASAPQAKANPSTPPLRKGRRPISPFYQEGARGELPREFLTIIDESHVTVPQIRAMYNGDKARKDVLVEHGFRLPSARDNRPLMYAEFEKRVEQLLYTSATPTEYELKESENIVQQVVRPTGLVDPEIIVRPITASRVTPPHPPLKKGGAVLSADFFRVVKAGFAQRRKLLIKNLKSITGKNSGEELLKIFEELGLNKNARAQELSVEQWRVLVRKVESL
jgi:excinuclease ABC subunit B